MIPGEVVSVANVLMYKQKCSKYSCVHVCVCVCVQVQDMKKDLSGVGVHMEEIRGVCRQLQSHLKALPDCSDAPFDAESDTLMDSWLDVSLMFILCSYSRLSLVQSKTTDQCVPTNVPTDLQTHQGYRKIFLVSLNA